MRRRSWFWPVLLAVVAMACSLVPDLPLSLGGGEATVPPTETVGLDQSQTAADVSSPTPASTRAAATPQPTEHPSEGGPTPSPGSGDGQTSEGAEGGPVVVPPDLSATERLLPPLEEWEEWIKPGSHVEGDNHVAWIEVPGFGQVAEFVRAQGGRDGGGAGLSTNLQVDVNDYEHLYLSLRARILEERGGNIANVNPRWFPEGAVQVRVTYIAQDGSQAEWYHGFYHATRGQPDKVHFTTEPVGEWFVWSSEDLMALPNPPARIETVLVYGFGWEFRGQVAGINLFATPRGGGQTEGGTSEGGACRLVAVADVPVFAYPSDEAEPWGTLPGGTEVEILAFTPDRTWMGFEPGVAQACNVGPFRLRWVPVTQSSWSEGDCEGVPVIQPPPPDLCFVGGARATVYAEPSTEAQVVGVMQWQEYAAVIGRGPGDWLKVNLNVGKCALQGEGWVSLSETCFIGYGPCDSLPIIQ